MKAEKEYSYKHLLLVLALLTSCDPSLPSNRSSSDVIVALSQTKCRELATSPRVNLLSFDDVLRCLNLTSPEAWPPLLERGRQAAPEETSTNRTFLNYYNARLYERHGKYQQALELYRQTLKVFEAQGEPKWIAATLHNEGALYSALGRGTEALGKLEAALRIYESLGESEREAGVLTQMGWVFFLQRDEAQATALLEKALRKRTTLRGRAVTLDRLGSVHRDAGRSVEALSCYREALEIFQELQEPIRGHVLANLGWLHLDLDEVEAAENELLTSLPLLRRVGDRDAEAHVLVGLARMERRRRRPLQALKYLEDGIEIVETLREATPLRPLRSTYLALRQDYFVDHVELLVELDRLEPGQGYGLRAMEASEQGRARALLDILALGSGSRASLEPADQEEFESLGRRLTNLQLEVLKKRRSGQAVAQEELEALGYALEGYSSLREQARGSRTARVAESHVIGIQEVQALLDHQTTILDFVLGVQQSYLFLIEHDRWEIHPLRDRKSLETAARDLQLLLADGSDSLSRDQITQLTHFLSAELLGPVTSQLGQRITVIKDGALHLVPFGLLSAPGEPGRFLIQDHEMTVAPSLSSLVRLQERSRGLGAAPRVAIFAPDAGSRPRNAQGAFPRLPFVAAEVRAIEEQTSPDRLLRYLGTEATPERLEEVSLASVDILHLATHAFVFQPYPELSAIVLTDSEGVDELVHLQDVFELEIDAHLVVLSACETALGDLLPGEGMVSLAQAFLGAGATQTLVSLWRIDDASTAMWMDEFYRELGQGQVDPATALRRTQLRFLESHPYRWAAFELLGV